MGNYNPEWQEIEQRKEEAEEDQVTPTHPPTRACMHPPVQPPISEHLMNFTYWQEMQKDDEERQEEEEGDEEMPMHVPDVERYAQDELQEVK